MNPRILKVDRYRVVSLYRYESQIRHLLLRYKEGKDQYLSRVFLAEESFILPLLLRNWVVVCAPSRQESMVSRGFHHLEKMMDNLKIPVVSVFENIAKYDQSQSVDRSQITEYIVLKDAVAITNKKVVIFDDIITSGNTMKRCLDLVSPKARRVIGFSITYSTHYTHVK